MESADLAKEIDTALGATYLHLHNSGACSTVQVGRGVKRVSQRASRGRHRGRQEGHKGRREGAAEDVTRAPRSRGPGGVFGLALRLAVVVQ